MFTTQSVRKCEWDSSGEESRKSLRMEKEQRRSEDGSTLRNCSCRIQREFDWTIRVRNLRRRASTSNQPRNIHLQYKPESKTYASRRRYRTRVRYDAWPKKKRKERTWPLPVRVLPCIFAGVVPVRPWVVKCQSLQM